MKIKVKKLLMLSALLMSVNCHAEYSIVIPLTDIDFKEKKIEKWIPTDPVIGEWSNKGTAYDCTNWSPATNTKDSGQQFNQTATDCKQNQERTIQVREISNLSLQVRVTEEKVESRTNTNQNDTRSAIGTKITEECKYAYTTQNGNAVGNYYILTDGGNSYPYWNGVQVGKGNGSNPITYIKDGYMYYAGGIMRMNVFIYYTICRKAV